MSLIETFAQLGVYINGYLAVSTILDCLNTNFNDEDWIQLVKRQVKIMNDPTMDIHAAFELMESQNHKCKHCQVLLTLDNLPLLTKTEKHHRFLGMSSIESKFAWECYHCASPADNVLLRKIERLVAEEWKDEKENYI